MMHALPHWIGRLLGVDAPSGEGTGWSIELAWPWPPWLTVLFLAFAVVFVVAVYLREAPRSARPYRMMLAAVRLALVAVALLMLSQLTLLLKRTGPPYAAVLLDDSLSTTTVDHYGQPLQQDMAQRAKEAGCGQGEISRWNLAQTLLTEHNGAMLRHLAEQYRLRAYLLTSGRVAEPQDMAANRQDVDELVKTIRSTKPSGESTRLGDVVRAVLDDLRGGAPAAVVVLSDGVNTVGPPLAEAADDARRRGVPLFMIGLGSDRPTADLRLSDLLVDEVVFVDDAVNFECRLTANGMEGRRLSVALQEKDKPAPLAKVDLTAGADGRSQPVRLLYRPTEVGRFEYVVSAESQGGEPAVQSNVLSRTVQVRKEKIRVLLVQGYPSFEFRYLSNMFKRDKTIALRTVLQEADLEHVGQDAAALRIFPMRREELFDYDAVIFGDVDPSMLNPSSLQDLAEFVDQPAKGGALVLIAGPKYMPTAYRDTPLARLMPFDPSGATSPDASQTLKDGFIVQPTELGLTCPSMQLGDSLHQTREIWQHLPQLYWLLETPRLKPGVRVLAENPDKRTADGRPLPVICLQYVGAGKVLFHATDETWRWRWRLGDALFARYWVQTIRYLCRAKLADRDRPVVLTADRRQYAQGEPVRLRADFADERLAPPEDGGVSVVVEQAGQPTQRVQLHRAAVSRGVFEGVLTQPAPGSYHAWIASPTLEGNAPAADFTVAPPAGEFAETRMDAAEMRRAAAQTGGKFYTFETAGQLIGDLPPSHRIPVETLPPYALWNRWPVLAAFLTLLVGEWILRKRKGMV